MIFLQSKALLARQLQSVVLIAVTTTGVVIAQNRSPKQKIISIETHPNPLGSAQRAPAELRDSDSQSSSQYFDPQGASSSELVRRALAGNAELAAARLDIERARGAVIAGGSPAESNGRLRAYYRAAHRIAW